MLLKDLQMKNVCFSFGTFVQKHVFSYSEWPPCLTVGSCVRNGVNTTTFQNGSLCEITNLQVDPLTALVTAYYLVLSVVCENCT